MKRHADRVSEAVVADESAAPSVQPEASRWALGLFWGSVAFASFALLLLIASFFA